MCNIQQVYTSLLHSFSLSFSLSLPLVSVDMSTLARELGFLARRNLAQILDHHSSTGMDWRGLVDQMGFSYEMNMLLSTRQSPTLSLLEEWERVLGECGAPLVFVCLCLHAHLALLTLFALLRLVDVSGH